MIELKHIWQTYKSPDGKTTLDAVKDVSITINDGEIFGVLGRSGAGKSTLVRCINLLNRPTKGNVIVDGQDLTKLSASELRRVRHKIGMIFQHFNLMPSRTVACRSSLPVSAVTRSGKRLRRCLSSSALRNMRRSIPRSFPAVRSSVSVLPEPWPTTRLFCFLTKPPRLSTRKPRRPPSPCCARSIRNSASRS